MAQQDGVAKKSPAVAALHSHFTVGSVSEENSEDENLGKPGLQLEERETRSSSPSSDSSSNFEIGLDRTDGPTHNLRLECRPGLSPLFFSVFTEYWYRLSVCVDPGYFIYLFLIVQVFQKKKVLLTMQTHLYFVFTFVQSFLNYNHNAALHLRNMKTYFEFLCAAFNPILARWLANVRCKR